MEKKQIVFIESFPQIMVSRIAKLLKERGYETISIRLLESKGLDKKHFEKDYDQVIYLDLNFFKFEIKNVIPIFFSLLKKMKNLSSSFISILKLKPYAVIGRAVPSWPTALIIKLLRKTPVIYFPYDIRTQVYDSPKKAMEIGKIPRFEINSERYCFEHADGIIHKGHPDELKYLNGRMLGDNIKFAKLQLNFFPYSSKEFVVPINKNKLSKKDNEIHTVYIGSAGSTSQEGASPLFDSFMKVIKQKIHVHFYAQPITMSVEESVRSFFIDKYKDILNSKYFHIHTPLSPKEIVKEISKYDFGIWPSVIDLKMKNNAEAKFCTGNKLASYLEAGIPFFYPPEAETVDLIMKKYGLSMPLDEDNLENLKKKIKKLNYKILEEKILKARQDYLMENQIDNFERFIELVVKNKKEREN